jgi:hypothetical protein
VKYDRNTNKINNENKAEAMIVHKFPILMNWVKFFGTENRKSKGITFLFRNETERFPACLLILCLTAKINNLEMYSYVKLSTTILRHVFNP